MIFLFFEDEVDATFLEELDFEDVLLLDPLRTIKRSPTRRECRLEIPFNSQIRSTEVPFFAAMRNNVSPFRTLYVVPPDEAVEVGGNDTEERPIGMTTFCPGVSVISLWNEFAAEIEVAEVRYIAAIELNVSPGFTSCFLQVIRFSSGILEISVKNVSFLPDGSLSE